MTERRKTFRDMLPSIRKSLFGHYMSTGSLFYDTEKAVPQRETAFIVV